MGALWAYGRPMTTETAQYTVRTVVPVDARAVAEAMARAFLHDPVAAHCLPDPARRARRLERGFELFLRRTYLPREGTFTTDGLDGGALWLPPNEWNVGRLETLRLLPAMARCYRGDLLRVLRVFDFLEKRHPEEPHWYLGFLGVEPDRQGRGIGSALLEPVLARCDRERVPAYLEASTERNRRLYERHGFGLVEEIRLPGGGPPMWRMWREAR